VFLSHHQSIQCCYSDQFEIVIIVEINKALQTYDTANEKVQTLIWRFDFLPYSDMTKKLINQGEIMRAMGGHNAGRRHADGSREESDNSRLRCSRLTPRDISPGICVLMLL